MPRYAFARSYDHLDSPNFKDTLHDALVAIYSIGPFALQFPLVFPILDIMPEWLVRRTQPDVLPVVGLRKVSIKIFLFFPPPPALFSYNKKKVSRSNKLRILPNK